MVKLKTKSDKHISDNEKRRKSIKEKEKAKLNQSQVIKQALSNSNLHRSSSKKIFDDDGNEKNENTNGKDKTVLFDGSGSEDESFEIKEKAQFDSKKGFELLNLQSTYGNDTRFKIDKRFLENEKDELESCEGDNLENGADEEKSKSMKILESVLGEPIFAVSEKKTKKRTLEMIRYDASNKDHEKYEVKAEPEPTIQAKRKKERKKSEKYSQEQLPKTQVSKEKFYEVSKEIKNSFKDNKDKSGQFSLLQTYGGNDGEKTDNMDVEEDDNNLSKGKQEMEENAMVSEEEEEEGKSINKKKRNEKNDSEKSTVNSKGALVQGIWRESFFFSSNDPRFEEGLEFINKKNSEEATKAAENYDNTRRRLKEILRLHMKKQMHKKDPFKNKIGGMNKKQLANSKFKNFKSKFSRRIPPKMKPGGKA